MFRKWRTVHVLASIWRKKSLIKNLSEIINAIARIFRSTKGREKGVTIDCGNVLFLPYVFFFKAFVVLDVNFLVSKNDKILILRSFKNIVGQKILKKWGTFHYNATKYVKNYQLWNWRRFCWRFLHLSLTQTHLHGLGDVWIPQRVQDEIIFQSFFLPQVATFGK